MKIQYFYTDKNSLSVKQIDTFESFCDDNCIDLELIDVNKDEDAMVDYQLNSIPSMIMYDDCDRRVKTHYGRIDREKLSEMYQKFID